MCRWSNSLITAAVMRQLVLASTHQITAVKCCAYRVPQHLPLLVSYTLLGTKATVMQSHSRVPANEIPPCDDAHPTICL